MKKSSIAIALCCAFLCTSVSAKTFVGVLYPLFGPVAALGLVDLVSELKSMPDVEVVSYLHQAWPRLVDDINRQPSGTHTLIIGYSLGANNAVLVANRVSHVDAIIALQPSMFTSNPTVTGDVGRIVEMYNPNPLMTFGGMGSRRLVGPNIEYIVNNDSHPGAQFNSEFRSLVKTEIARLSAEDQNTTNGSISPETSILSAQYPPPQPPGVGLSVAGVPIRIRPVRHATRTAIPTAAPTFSRHSIAAPWSPLCRQNISQSEGRPKRYRRGFIAPSSITPQSSRPEPSSSIRRTPTFT